MKALVLLFSLLVATSLASAIELQPIAHKNICDNRTYVRDATDRRYSVWTDDIQKADDLLRSFGFQKEGFVLKKGEVLAVFLNHRIEEDLVQITRNKTAQHTFADYADSGMRFKLKALENGKKYSHATAVVFTVSDIPDHIGVRGFVFTGIALAFLAVFSDGSGPARFSSALECASSFPVRSRRVTASGSRAQPTAVWAWVPSGWHWTNGEPNVPA